MISPRPALSSSGGGFFAFRPGASSSPTASPPPSPRLAAPPPLSASFSTSATATAVAAPADHAAASSSFYDVLGLRPGASARDIKAAYRRLARAVHPDAAPPHSSADDFIRVHAAYSTLSDPDKRADYDRRLLLSSSGAGRPAFGRSPSFPARRRRTWETDQCW
ncbi:hypothetical protein QOZ80_3AG0240740 [Eleusine coracana subsp. coracana]|nr:hypothetical protein QOZ80_3AG0240740 [Eleusine coracana subsp. coracana]